MAGATPTASQGLIVRPCASPSDCLEVVSLTAQAFPEEVSAQGISARTYCQIEAEDLIRQKHFWPSIGLACEGGKVLGTVVLSFADEADGGITYWQYSRRVGCVPTLLTLAYDHVLEEPLKLHECLIDFIAVAAGARGRGVGAALVAWAEQMGAELLAGRAAAEVAAQQGGCMTLWVAADNATACRLYERNGYKAVKRTDQGACNCIMSRVFKRFLGHPTWIKMSKQLPAPTGLALAKPEPCTIAVAAAPAQQDKFEVVALEESHDEPTPPILPSLGVASASSNGEEKLGRVQVLELAAAGQGLQQQQQQLGGMPARIAAFGGIASGQRSILLAPAGAGVVLGKHSSVQELSCLPVQLGEPAGSQAPVTAQRASMELQKSSTTSPRSRQGSVAGDAGVLGLLTRTLSASGSPLVVR